MVQDLDLVHQQVTVQMTELIDRLRKVDLFLFWSVAGWSCYDLILSGARLPSCQAWFSLC